MIPDIISAIRDLDGRPLQPVAAMFGTNTARGTLVKLLEVLPEWLAQLADLHDEVERLKAENERLRAGIVPAPVAPKEPEPPTVEAEEPVANDEVVVDDGWW